MTGTVPNTITPGQIKDLSAALTQAVPLDMGSDVAQGWIGNKTVLHQKVRTMLCPPATLQQKREELFELVENVNLVLTRNIYPMEVIFKRRVGVYPHNEVRTMAIQSAAEKVSADCHFDFCVLRLLRPAKYIQISSCFKYHFSWDNVGGLMGALVTEFESKGVNHHKTNHRLSLKHQNLFLMPEVLYMRWGEGSFDWHVNTDTLGGVCEAGSYVFAPMNLTLD